MRLPLLILAAVALPLAACGGSDDASVADAEVEETGQAGVFGQLGQLQDAAEQMQAAAERPPADPVNFRILRDQLPETLDGYERTNAEGATQSAMGFAISEANATYTGAESDAGAPEITLKIADYGALPSLALMGMAWTMADVDRETSTGYEKTVQMAGHRGYRTYDTESRRGEFSLSVAERFLVQVSGSNVDDAQIEDALRAVNVDALAAMRDEGRQAAAE